MKAILNKINYPILSVVLFLLIAITTLFVKPIIGMADNGDYYRIISQNDLYHLEQDDEDKFFGYFSKEYGIYQYNNETEATMISTQTVFIKVAKFIDTLFTKDYKFDIRVMAIIFLIIQAFALYLITKVFLYEIDNNIYKLIIVTLTTVIFSDTAYLAYYNSFYGEAVMICCFLYSIGIILYMCKFNKFTVCNLILFGISTLLFFGAKQQLAPIGILASILLIRIAYLNKEIRIRVTSIVLTIIFLFSSVYFYKSITGDFDYINRYHAMTRGILLDESNPDEILKGFDIYYQYSLLENEIFFQTIPMINPNAEKLKDEFYSKYSVFNILIYYIKNPKSLIKMTDLAFKNAYSIRPKAMGNYEKSEGKEFGEMSNYFTLWSTFKENVLPKGMVMSIIYILLYLVIAYKRYKKALFNRENNSVLVEEIFIYVLLAGLSQIFASIVGAGDADLAKHVFMYNLSFDLMILFTISNVLKNKDNKRREN